MKKKKNIIFIIVIALITILIIFLFSKKEDKKVKTNNNKTLISSDITKNAKIKDLDITNIRITHLKGSGSTMSLTLTNNTKNTISLEYFDIILKDKDGNEIANFSAYVRGDVTPNQTNNMKINIEKDVNIKDAKSIEYIAH